VTAAVAAEQPPSYPTDPCEGCKAPIIWAITDNGRHMPVDIEPVGPNSGNVLLTGPPRAPRAEVVRNPAKLFGKANVYRSHFVTCPYAERYRHPRRHR
jgi:hypothetical protein